MTRSFSAERRLQSKPWRISKPRSPRALGELPPGSTGLFHLVIVYHPGQNGATYLRANNAAPQFSPSEASTDYVNQNRSYYTSPSRIERQIKVVKAPARSPAREARALPRR